MSGVTANCDSFYKVSAGDTCDIIASENNITTDQFKGWNTGINAGMKSFPCLNNHLDMESNCLSKYELTKS